ncbi:virion structural protein [Xanthomonas phage MET13-T1]|nr:virion structural protein [Xanthomonas phage MET13-T1]
MATFDYQGMKDDVDALLAEFGQSCRLRRPGGPVVVDPVDGTVTPGSGPTDFPVVGVITDYSDKQVDGENIRRGDRLVYIQAVERPKQGDVFLEESGTQWAIVDFDSVDPAGLALLFALQLRR